VEGEEGGQILGFPQVCGLGVTLNHPADFPLSGGAIRRCHGGVVLDCPGEAGPIANLPSSGGEIAPALSSVRAGPMQKVDPARKVAASGKRLALRRRSLVIFDRRERDWKFPL